MRSVLATLVALALLANPLPALGEHPLCQDRKDICEIVQARGKGGAPEAILSRVASTVWTPVSGRTYEFLLLGEIHDNPLHHRLRAEMIDKIDAPGGPKPALVFEHIASDRQADLDAFTARMSRRQRLDGLNEGTRALFAMLDWQRSGWPEADLFRPLFQSALRRELRIVAGHPPREKVRAVARKGLSELSPEARAALHLETLPSGPLRAAVLDELERSHCGLMPKTAFDGMAAAQAYRDAAMAERMVYAAGNHGTAVLLAGNGHVRSDRGVPFFLRRRTTAANIVTVMFAEVEPGKNAVAEYLPRYPDGAPAVDYLYLTRPVARDDPCEAMRNRRR